MISPTRQPVCLAPAGTLARAYSTRAGLSRYPSRTSQGEPCSFPLTRDARSRRDWGLHCVRANRAGCKEGRQGSTIGHWRGRSLPLSSLRFREAAHQFRAHNSDLHQSSRLGRRAAGRVQRTSPRLSIFLEVDDFAHRGGSTVSLPDLSEFRRRPFHGSGISFHARHR